MKAVLLSLVIGLMVSVNAMAVCQRQLSKNVGRFDVASNAYSQALNAPVQKQPAQPASQDSYQN